MHHPHDPAVDEPLRSPADRNSAVGDRRRGGSVGQNAGGGPGAVGLARADTHVPRAPGDVLRLRMAHQPPVADARTPLPYEMRFQNEYLLFLTAADFAPGSS